MNERSTTEHEASGSDPGGTPVALLDEPESPAHRPPSTPPPLPSRRVRRRGSPASTDDGHGGEIKPSPENTKSGPGLPERTGEAWPTIDPRQTGHRPRQIWRRLFTPCTVSLLIHLTAVLIAAAWVVPLVVAGAGQVVVVGFAETDTTDDLEQMQPLCLLDELPAPEAVAVDMAVDAIDMAAAADVAPTAQPLVVTAAVDWQDSVSFPAAVMLRDVGEFGAANPAAGQLREAGSVEAAVDGIVGDIRGRLDHDDLLVVWLFDASISLLDDRRRVAERLHGMFAAIAADAPSHRLLNAAVAFGTGSRSLVGPTDNVARIVSAVRDVPIDQSGTENVLAAVDAAVQRYTRRWQRDAMVVVWTDESGDDLDRLETTIDLCRQHGVAVSVVGPTAMLGRRAGTHVFRDSATGQVFRLPIERGPDSALPERLYLPYWYEGNLPSWAAAMAWGAAGLPPWYGGAQLERLSSGFGPYALTRLALATGGTYTAFDRAADRGPFRLETMRPYRPDYRRTDTIALDLRNHPLQQAILDVVAMSRDTASLAPPETAFFVNRPSGAAGPRLPLYYPPPRFRSALRREIGRRKLQAIEAQAAVDDLLVPFGPDGMEAEYEQESSPRWRAWYDLTRGRLLAMSVRNAEYATLAELLARRGAIGPQTNHVVLVPSRTLRGSAEVRSRADEAERLLDRCMKQNPQTPWAYLAQRELDYPLGIDYRQTSVPPPVPVAPVGGGGVPTPAAPQVSVPRL